MFARFPSDAVVEETKNSLVCGFVACMCSLINIFLVVYSDDMHSVVNAPEITSMNLRVWDDITISRHILINLPKSVDAL